MGHGFSTNIKHFLDSKGSIPDAMPAPARAMANYIGAIVSATTSGSLKASVDTGVQCLPARGQKPCSGKIIGSRDITSSNIHWECTTCGNYGVIFDWEGTLWDRRADHEEQAN